MFISKDLFICLFILKQQQNVVEQKSRVKTRVGS